MQAEDEARSKVGDETLEEAAVCMEDPAKDKGWRDEFLVRT